MKKGDEMKNCIVIRILLLALFVLFQTLVFSGTYISADVAKTSKPGFALAGSDSIPCLIITDSTMTTQFENFALIKTKSGTNTLVKYIENILVEYTGDSIPGVSDSVQSVRECIKDFYNNKYTEWVIIGGDIDIIPGMIVPFGSSEVLTDLYYSNLDNNWNENGDSLFAQSGLHGDTVDFVSEVYVGRIPCSNSSQATAILDKIIAYQWDTTVIGFQNQAMVSGTNLHIEYNDYLVADGYLDAFPILTEIISYFPQTLNHRIYYEKSETIVQDAIRDGKGLLINCSQTDAIGQYLTHWQGSPGDGESFIREHVTYDFFDTLSTNGKYTVFFNFTCYNNDLRDSLALSKHFMQSVNGGGVAYIGNTDYNYSNVYPEFYYALFENIFTNGITELGKALSISKDVLIPNNIWYHGIDKSAVMGYLLLGDPQMRIYTATPQILEMTGASDTLPQGFHTVNINVSSNGVKVDSALVCLRLDTLVYATMYTNDTGLATRSFNFAVTGITTVVASKQNYFYVEDTIVVGPAPPPSCPKLHILSGREYSFVNNILAHSEDIASNDYANDFYPMMSVPIFDGKVRFIIIEDENEVSSFNFIKGFGFKYDNDKTLVFTDKNRFKVLSGNSLQPISALHNGKTDVTNELSSEDGLTFSDDQPGYLVLKYSGTSNGSPSPSLPSFGPGGGGGPPPCCKGGGSKLIAWKGSTYHQHNIMKVSALDGSGNWVGVSKIYPRYNQYDYLTELQEYFIVNELTIKLEWSVAIELDHMPYQFFTPEGLEVIEYPIDLARHSSDESTNQFTLESEVNRTTLVKGDSLFVQFDIGSQLTSTEKMAFIFLANGKYEQDRSGVSSGIVSDFTVYPNPANPATTFSFSLTQPIHISIDIYNVLGQKVVNVVDKDLEVGTHNIRWDGKNEIGSDVASGIYFGRLNYKDISMSKKLVIVR